MIALARAAARRVQQIALGQNDEVGAGDLILEHFLDRIVMVERLVGAALCGKRVEVGSDPAFGEGRAVDHGNDAVDRHAAFHGGPLERLHQRLRQSQAGGLDQDVIDLRRARQDLVERRHEIVGDGAADAAIRQFDDVFLRAGIDAAALQDFAVDADVAEFVDDDGETLALGVFEDMADQRRLAGAEEAGDDGAGNAGQGSGHAISLRSIEGRDARDEAALQGVGASPPRDQAVGRGGEQPCAGDEVEAAVGR